MSEKPKFIPPEYEVTREGNDATEEQTRLNSRLRQAVNFLETVFDVKDLSTSELIALKRTTAEVYESVDHYRKKKEEEGNMLEARSLQFHSQNMEIALRWLDELYGLDISKFDPTLFNTALPTQAIIKDLDTGEISTVRMSNLKNSDRNREQYQEHGLTPAFQEYINEVTDIEQSIAQKGHASSIDESVDGTILNIIRKAREDANPL